MNKNNKRNTSFWSANMPLVSKRVNLILSNPIDSKKLAQCIRSKRIGIDKPFKISKNINMKEIRRTKDSRRTKNYDKLKELEPLKKESGTASMLLLLLLLVLTLCLVFPFLYGVLIYNSEYRNRKRLLKLLKSKKYNLVFNKTKNINGDKISIFTLNDYNIWLHHDGNRLSVDVMYPNTWESLYNYDAYERIGLFEGDIINMYLVYRINRILKSYIK
jgi:membrane-associated HD superfamily phosphohydrolase